MRELSVFVDESGDFGNYERHNPYYVLVLLFHDQSNNISDHVGKLDKHLTDCGLQIQNIHTGPLIRQEDEFFHMSLQTRRSLFRSIAGFTAKCDVAYKSFVIERRQYPCRTSLRSRLQMLVEQFFINNIGWFADYDRIVVYYDNGQSEVRQLLVSVCDVLIGHAFEYRVVKPAEYKLFQAADYVCTIERLAYKARVGCLTKSERLFFSIKSKELKGQIKAVHRRRFVEL